MKVGKRLACDKCGRIETPKITVHIHPSDPSKHLCDNCKQTLYYQSIEAVAKKSDTSKML